MPIPSAEKEGSAKTDTPFFTSVIQPIAKKISAGITFTILTGVSADKPKSAEPYIRNMMMAKKATTAITILRVEFLAILVSSPDNDYC